MADNSESKPKKQQNVEDEKNDNQVDKKNLINAIKESAGILTLVIIWALAGIAAFVYSLYCFTKSGTTADKVLGLIIAMVAGPFYFIYVAVYQAYCR